MRNEYYKEVRDEAQAWTPLHNDQEVLKGFCQRAPCLGQLSASSLFSHIGLDNHVIVNEPLCLKNNNNINKTQKLSQIYWKEVNIIHCQEWQRYIIYTECLDDK